MIVADRFHLTYCSNIHAGESWSDVRAALGTALPRVREQLGVTGPFAVGLRLSAEAAATLSGAAAQAEFAAFLRDGRYYLLTINGFPYGAFHGMRVKERVYLPDWRTAARLEYTNRLATLLAALAGDGLGIERSVSTVPGAFRSEVRGEADAAAIADNMLRHAAHLIAIRQSTGTYVSLAVEPEPACFIETIADAEAFFGRYLFEAGRVAAVARETGVPMTVDTVRTHVGLCLDACHMAVEFEDASAAFDRLRGAGIRVGKVQISSALQCDDCEPESIARALRPFADDTYLHQVVERADGQLTRYVDLPDALAAVEAGHGPRDWRIHFHVPIFLRDLGTLRTSQPYLEEVLRLLIANGDCPFLEVETYTWDVLPPEHRTTDVWTAIARELAWVRTQLTA